MLARLPQLIEIFFNLPYPIVVLWIVWGVGVPLQLGYLFRRNPDKHQLAKTGELMNFREVVAVGCIAGFILLTFIAAFCTYMTLSLADVI